MTEVDPMSAAAFAAVMRRAEPKLAAALARYGVKTPNELPVEIARQIFNETLVQTAVESFPDAQVEALAHGLIAFQHPLFGPSFRKIQSQLETPGDAFAFVSGIDAAIVLAGFGLPVAPFDRKNPRILAEPSNDIETVVKNFSNWKSAIVGYSPCDMPFYMLLTDCVRTMHLQISNRPELREAKQLLARAGESPPMTTSHDFQHGILFIAREPGDAVSTVFLNNPNPNQGSIALYAGWTVKGVRLGTPNDGFIPVPRQFLRAAAQDPQIATWIWKPVGAKVVLN